MDDDGSLEWQTCDISWDGLDGTHREYGEKIKQGDEIKMILIPSKGILRYERNGKDLGVAYDNIDTSKTYCMALAVFPSKKGYLQLTSFFIKSF